MKRQPGRPARALSPAQVSAAIRAEARRLGISAIGFTKDDPRYTFAGFGAE